MNQSQSDDAQHEEDFSSMWEALEADYDYIKPTRGEIREGVILRVAQNEVLVDIGAKQDAVVSSQDMQNMSPEELAQLQVGAKIHVYITRPDAREGNPVVSINLARAYEDWLRAEKLLETGETVECTVASFNKGGLVCPFGRLQGFVPMSQISNLSQRTEGATGPDALAVLIGQELVVKVIEVNRRRRRLILSERAARREWRAQQREQLLAEIQEGEIRTGAVSSLRDFGAFVDLGGMDGLVHISELSWSRVGHPSEVLRVGQQVDVMVLRVDEERQRIGLSLKRTQPNPWTLVDENYTVGSLIKGVVTHLVDFGAFVEVEPGVEGLVHVSELAEGSVDDPRSVVSEGQEVTVLVLGVDSEKHHLSLSLRQAPEQAEEDIDLEAQDQLAEDADPEAQEQPAEDSDPEAQEQPADEARR